jgi:hypothetical protein
MADPIDAASGDPNLYRYCGNDPINATDPSGQDWLDDAANFFAGWGDTLTFGLTAKIRQWMGVDSVVNRCSGWYNAGEVTGILHTTALGGWLGYARNARLAGLSRPDPALGVRLWQGARRGESGSVALGAPAVQMGSQTLDELAPEYQIYVGF